MPLSIFPSRLARPGRYHSESGWEALVEAILEHYGLDIDEAAITVFVCFVPVVIDACVKLWVGPRLRTPALSGGLRRTAGVRVSDFGLTGVCVCVCRSSSRSSRGCRPTWRTSSGK